jgi:hypothetical protein
MGLWPSLLPALEGGRKPRLDSELRREEQRLSRTKVCVDLEGTVHDMSKGVYAYLSSPTPARPESHISKGRVGPTRRAQAGPLG